MTDYVKQFLENYRPAKGSVVLGFSFGSMIAIISAQKVRPKMLILCSLSPFLREYLPLIKKSWKIFMGKRRMSDLREYSVGKITKKTVCKVILLAGDKEIKSVLQRAKYAKRKLKNSRLVTIKNAKHDVGQKEYLML